MLRRSVLTAIVLTALACSGNDGEVERAAPAGAHDAVGAAPADSPVTTQQALRALPPVLLGTADAPTGQAVHYFPQDEATTGYLAVPDGPGPHGAVILIHEWNGLVDRVRQMADLLAEQGYVALAADLYSGRTGSNPQENRALVQETQSSPQTIIANLDAAAAFLRARDDVSGRIATIGWCFGGGVALSYAMGGENHDGTAIFYGRLVTDPDSLASIRHPIYGTFAAEDQGIPPEQVSAFVQALRVAGVENDVHVYDDVDHGFWLYVDRQPEERAVPALDAWLRLQRFLSGTIGR